MKPTALITGITGFIGGELARRLLDEGWTVCGIIRESSKIDDLGDIRDDSKLYVHDGTIDGMLELVRSCRPDVVFHLASEVLSEHKPNQISSLIESNITFGTQLIEAMVYIGCSYIVNTGTSWQHYHSCEYRPVNLYAATKKAFDDVLEYYHDAHDLSYITLKLFDTYGERDKRNKLINYLVNSARNGRQVNLSPGDQLIDISNIKDVVECYFEAAIRLINIENKIKEYYFVSGDRMTVKELVSEVESSLGISIKKTFGARPYRKREVMSLELASRAHPVWPQKTPKFKLRDGLKKV